jgi:hypothetical protein
MHELLDRTPRQKQESPNLVAPGKREALNFPGLLEKNAVEPEQPAVEPPAKPTRKQKTPKTVEEKPTKKAPNVKGAKIL